MEKDNKKQREESYTYFWCKGKSKFSLLRIDLNPYFFPNMESITRHIMNHFKLTRIPTFCIEKDGNCNTRADSVSEIKGKQVIVVENGMTPSRCAPGFMKEHQNIDAVNNLFSSWNELIANLKENNPQNEDSPIQSLFDSNGNLSAQFSTVARQFGVSESQALSHNE